jgi:hypothetical protein
LVLALASWPAPSAYVGGADGGVDETRLEPGPKKSKKPKLIQRLKEKIHRDIRSGSA